MCKFKTLAATITLSAAATCAYAQENATGWTLDPSLSNVSFGSIKNDSVGESFTFRDVTGSVSADGLVNISIGLASVDTMIEIRDERMVEFVFQNAPSASMTANVDMAKLLDLSAGEATTIETPGTLTLLGTETELDAVFFVMRLSDDKVLVTTDGILMLSAEDTGINSAIDTLQELAGLDSITRVSPVTMRLIFDAEQ